MSYILDRLSTDSVTSGNRSDTVTTTGEFSLFKKDIEQLNVLVTMSGPNMIRMKITGKKCGACSCNVKHGHILFSVSVTEDANANNQRYAVPVPITWSATSSQPQQQKLRFELTQTQYNQTGLRVRRQMGSTSSNNDSILFDTTYFAEGFIYDDQFLQIITVFPSNNVYGELKRR